mmetsp:Transcript_9258/g.12789  ORF Transcript_9258/g.12789 Transcript_9258/m.12789 type:complete len:107 (+) Transcript_9258:594-914(+)
MISLSSKIYHSPQAGIAQSIKDRVSFKTEVARVILQSGAALGAVWVKREVSTNFQVKLARTPGAMAKPNRNQRSEKQHPQGVHAAASEARQTLCRRCLPAACSPNR